MEYLSKRVAESGKGMVNQFPVSGGGVVERTISYFFRGRGSDATLGRQNKQSENGMTLQ